MRPMCGAFPARTCHLTLLRPQYDPRLVRSAHTRLQTKAAELKASARTMDAASGRDVGVGQMSKRTLRRLAPAWKLS